MSTAPVLQDRPSLPLTAKDFKSDQEVRWCPGCGDYSILATVQGFLPELGVPRENMVIISGIGCSSRFPYYMDTYGIHSIHGRAPAIATGLATSRPDLTVFVITGDGDALSIGGNHLIHTIRRNVNLTILLFNNRIYGLTKGQYSPTSEQGKVTKSTPLGSVEIPFNPISLAIGAEAGFVARVLDTDRARFTNVLAAATAYQGTALIEIYQNCSIFNNGAYDALKDPASRDDWLIPLEAGSELRFGTPSTPKAVIRDPATGSLRVATDVPAGDPRVVVHEPTNPDPSYAFALSRLGIQDPRLTPMGIFRDVARPSYDQLLAEQFTAARAAAPGDDEQLQSLLNGVDTWLAD